MSSWMAFLAVRKLLIEEMLAEGKSCTEIAQTLSMDVGQVWLISDRSSDPLREVPEDARQAITQYRDRVKQMLGVIDESGRPRS